MPLLQLSKLTEQPSLSRHTLDVAVAGGSPGDSEDDDVILDPEHHPASPAPAQPTSLLQPKQAAQAASDGPQSSPSAPAQTASQPQSAARGAGNTPTASAPAQPAQHAESDEDADTWQFMTLPSSKAQQPAKQTVAPAASEAVADAKASFQQRQGTPAAERSDPDARWSASESQAGRERSKPSTAEWEAELEPEDGAEGGRAAAAVIAAATIASAGAG